MKNEGNNVICIIGMHRSGTSMVARLLNLIGVYLGPDEQLEGPDEGNPVGHFEHKGFLEIDQKLLSIFGGSSDNPPDLLEGWENDSSLEPSCQAAKRLLSTFDQKHTWGWKDPRSTLLVPFWRKEIPNLRFIVCLRNPLEVSHSLAKRDRMSAEKSLYLWYRYTRAAIRDTEGCSRIFVFYEDFFDNALVELNRLLAFCNLKKPSDTSDIFAAISQELRRNIITPSDLLIDQTTMPTYKLLYFAVRALSLQKFPISTPLAEKEAVISDGIGKLTDVFDQLHDRAKVVQLKTSLVERTLKLTELTEETELLRTRLKGVEHSLAWQLMKKLDLLKENYFPAGTCRRNYYDRLLVSLKNRITIENR